MRKKNLGLSFDTKFFIHFEHPLKKILDPPLSMDLKVLLLYRKSDWEIRTIYELIHYLSNANDLDFIMGDFNLKPNEQLDQVLSEYKQIVSKPTYIAASILDQIYVNKSFLSKYTVHMFIESVFFTDHEAVSVRIGEKINK